ncbi:MULTISPECIES: isocitrate lyase/phosphoenolpyruvate mutase family protein [Actinoplanes]|uniref:isocitrate lyase/PEP mutase family protein n=1 Tax=Actinoplanes TaxID=1865 RepID=UPI000ABE8C5C|nr:MULTISPECIES: isocitrate lyase/phosphoenolpyruvate mutase family protein [Actinoplanes]GLY04133.1 2-methylisocitrate lyase [Actinoplanes sp. NBRC 101535]
MSQTTRAQELRALHDRRPLVLPNAWDAASARIIESAGAAAIATTSAGVSWAHGRSDGQQLSREDALAAVGRIVAVVNVPVTADIESGYGTGSPDDIAAIVRELVELGIAGINLEDAPGTGDTPLLDPKAQAERIQAARSAAASAGGDLVVNSRTDTYLRQVGPAGSRLDATLERLAIYRAAGADSLFVPGVVDEPTIEALVAGVDGPVNIMAGPGAPSIRRLGELGVARVSVGPLLTQVALEATRRAAATLLGDGDYGDAADAIDFGTVNGTFTR